MHESTPAMYGSLAGWFHELSPPDEYAEEAAEILRLLDAAVDAPLERLLELGTGGGNLVSHLPERIELTLTDPSAPMLELSERINPRARHIVGDMRDLRLGETFDAVLIHDAIGYMTTEDDLAAAFVTAWMHLRPGGAAVFAPDWLLDTFEPAFESGGTNAPDGRALRYLEWDRAIEPDGHSVRTDYVIVTRGSDGTTSVHHDVHRLGIFPRATWRSRLEAVGFVVETVIGIAGLELFVARRLS